MATSTRIYTNMGIAILMSLLRRTLILTSRTLTRIRMATSTRIYINTGTAIRMSQLRRTLIPTSRILTRTLMLTARNTRIRIPMERSLIRMMATPTAM